MADALGLNTGDVVVVPYDARWPILFEAAALELSEVLGPDVLAIHHVGSTSVPGLCAKPVLDMLASVRDFDEAVRLAPRIESLGYEFRPQEEIPDRHYFRRRIGKIRTHHLSLAEPASQHHRRTLAFRDALRRDPELAARYAGLKLGLAVRFPRDRISYLDGKTEFVNEVLGYAARLEALRRHR